MTLASILRQQSYDTGLFGKQHLGAVPIRVGALIWVVGDSCLEAAGGK